MAPSQHVSIGGLHKGNGFERDEDVILSSVLNPGAAPGTGIRWIPREGTGAECLRLAEGHGNEQ